MSTDFYFRDDRGQVRGPFNAKEIKAEVGKGRIHAETPLRRGETGPWSAATKWKGLNAAPPPIRVNFWPNRFFGTPSAKAMGVVFACVVSWTVGWLMGGLSEWPIPASPPSRQSSMEVDELRERAYQLAIEHTAEAHLRMETIDFLYGFAPKGADGTIRDDVWEVLKFHRRAGSEFFSRVQVGLEELGDAWGRDGPEGPLFHDMAIKRILETGYADRLKMMSPFDDDFFTSMELESLESMRSEADRRQSEVQER